MLHTVTPAALAAAVSTLSTPVAAKAISLSCGLVAMCSAVMTTLLVTTTSAPAIRAAVSSGRVDGYSITSAGKLKAKGSDTSVARSSTAIFQGVICCFLFYGAEDYSTAAKGRLKSCNGIEAAFSDGLCGYSAAGGCSRDVNQEAGNQHQLDTQLHQCGTADEVDKPSAGQE